MSGPTPDPYATSGADVTIIAFAIVAGTVLLTAHGLATLPWRAARAGWRRVRGAVGPAEGAAPPPPGPLRGARAAGRPDAGGVQKTGSGGCNLQPRCVRAPIW